MGHVPLQVHPASGHTRCTSFPVSACAAVARPAAQAGEAEPHCPRVCLRACFTAVRLSASAFPSSTGTKMRVRGIAELLCVISEYLSCSEQCLKPGQRSTKAGQVRKQTLPVEQGSELLGMGRHGSRVLLNTGSGPLPTPALPACPRTKSLPASSGCRRGRECAGPRVKNPLIQGAAGSTVPQVQRSRFRQKEQRNKGNWLCQLAADCDRPANGPRDGLRSYGEETRPLTYLASDG